MLMFLREELTSLPKMARARRFACLVKAKARVRVGLVPAREMDTANPLEFGGDRKTIGKL